MWEASPFKLQLKWHFTKQRNTCGLLFSVLIFDVDAILSGLPLQNVTVFVFSDTTDVNGDFRFLYDPLKNNKITLKTKKNKKKRPETIIHFIFNQS